MLTVFSSNGVRAVLLELAPEFERTSGHKLAITFNPANALKEQIVRGDAFDVTILTPPVMDEMVAQKRIAGASVRTIARVGSGLAVKTGARKADISTVDGFKRALLDATAIACSKVGASGIRFARVIDELGIGEQVRAKCVYLPGGLTGDLVARGEVDLAVQLMSELAAVEGGIDILGPFPESLQEYTVMVAGVSAAAREPAAAKALVELLTSDKARPILRAKGMEAAN